MNPIKKYLRRLLVLNGKKNISTKAMLTLFTALLVCPINTARAVNISDEPMETQVQSAAANIMFILDNSGSMDWEFLTTDSDGKFEGDIEYLFDDPGDNNYGTGSSNGTILTGADRSKWKSQWSGYNKVYYDPSTAYLPWPQTTANPHADADVSNPRSNPANATPTFDLTDEYHSIVGYDGEVIVDNTDAGFSVSDESHWGTSNYTNNIGTSYRFNETLTEDAWAQWTPGLPAAGNYEVYVWFRTLTTRSKTVSYTIGHAGGPTTISPISHHTDEGLGDQWILLGTFSFAGDGSDYVRLEAPIVDADCCDYSADAVKFVDPDTAAAATVSIKNAHYYTWHDVDEDGALGSGENVYLVNFVDGGSGVFTREYYRLDNTDGNNIVEDGELFAVTNTAEQNLIKPKLYDEDGNFVSYKTDAEDLQNFANWYQYYRRRELTAKAVVANAINSLGGVSIGLYSINTGAGEVRQSVLPIKLDMPASVIVDNKDAGFSTSGSGWNESGAKDEYEGSSYYNSNVGRTATWTPDLPVAGTYNVYAWWCYYNTRDTNALYTINHSGGSASMRKNQQQDAGQWILLGTYNFDAGTSGSVTVTRDGSSTHSSTSADAVMFEQVGGATVNVDETYTLLDQLYSMDSHDSTPLRRALENVGKYYHQDDGSDGNLGSSPFADALNGGACQKAYAIVMTDGYWNGGDPGVAVADADDGEGDPYEDTYSPTLADVAMYYYKTDLSSTLDDVVPSKACDTANHQHMTTYTLSFGVTGTIDLTDMDGDGQPDPISYADDPCFFNANTPVPTWPDPTPTAVSSEKIDDLFHAAVNGRGLFFSASNPKELIDAMAEIIGDIRDPASGASVSVNGEELGADTVLYQARYISGDWIGEVLAFPIDQTTGAVLNAEDQILWNSADKLERLGVTWDNRRILTYDGANVGGIKFRYNSLTTAQQDALKEADWSPEPSQEAHAERILEYVRGRSDNIGALNFRYRTKTLGDIVHSAPVLVGKTAAAESDFVDNDDDGVVDETGELTGATIFAGGNDGMLHAFDAQNGWERFAYVPNLVMENLKDLKDVNYSHRFYVDLTPYVKEIEISPTERKTYLVGGLGKGGKGYYSLLLRYRTESSPYTWTDVMNIDNFNDSSSEDNLIAAQIVQWEYPRADTTLDGMDNNGNGLTDEAGETDPDIGYSFSQAYLVKTNSTNAAHQWVVIFGNGYGSVGAKAVLYILDLNGTIIKKIHTDPSVSGNGLSTPSIVDINNDQQVDYVYAGDLQGNMWKFDLTADDATNWAVAYNDGTNPQPLIATGQPITSKPDVMRHCTGHGYMVVFGTGQFLHNDDRADLSQQTIYGIWDYGDDTDDAEYLGSFNHSTRVLSNLSGVTLLEQTIVDTRTISGHVYRTFSDKSTAWPTAMDSHAGEEPNPTTHAGWYVDFPNPAPSPYDYEGERVIKGVQIRDGKAIVISFIPDTSPCSGGGNSFLYIIDACDGSRMPSERKQFKIGTTDDLIEIIDPDTGNPIRVPPTGKRFVGTLHEPKIIRKPGTGDERLYMSSSTGVVETEDVPAERRGTLYWLER